MDKSKFVLESYNLLRSKGIVHTQKDFSNLLGYNAGSISRALKGDEKYITDSLISKISLFLKDGVADVPADAVSMFPALDGEPIKEQTDSLLVIPTEAMAGTLGEFAGSVEAYDCERMISPIKGADYAIKVCGDSMSPEYPSGSLILIKRINENAFVEWGKVYVLDTDNGAVIKKIRKTDKENVVECVSLNPEFQPFTIDTSFIHGWYRVLMAMSMK